MCIRDRCSKEKGAAGLAECCDKMFRALSEYCLQTDAKLTGTVTLTAKPEGVWSVSYTHLDVYKRQPLWITVRSGW